MTEILMIIIIAFVAGLGGVISGLLLFPSIQYPQRKPRKYDDLWKWEVAYRPSKKEKQDE